MYEEPSLKFAIILGGRSKYFRVFLSLWATAVRGGFRGDFVAVGASPIPLSGYPMATCTLLHGAAVAPLVRAIPTGAFSNHGPTSPATTRPPHLACYTVCPRLFYAVSASSTVVVSLRNATMTLKPSHNTSLGTSTHSAGGHPVSNVLPQ